MGGYIGDMGFGGLGFPKIRGTFWRSILGSPYFGKLSHTW